MRIETLLSLFVVVSAGKRSYLIVRWCAIPNIFKHIHIQIAPMPNCEIQTLMNALATVSAVISLISMAAGHQVKLSTHVRSVRIRARKRTNKINVNTAEKSTCWLKSLRKDTHIPSADASVVKEDGTLRKGKLRFEASSTVVSAASNMTLAPSFHEIITFCTRFVGLSYHREEQE
ncbi:unnamed protein product [Lepeophtheirus salmonis]|uniref:(salmon louse) hypothetical protein n=1 Tax=Lepeophtheirus salmonis TaxID=72036 RepID=A0A7R8GZG8_LEPSM|nr:unnamed protein product [Lepeophtheirus salmonis]CAF2764153.1 unnamed protein product [Lepeophtheirus salmonis]